MTLFGRTAELARIRALALGSLDGDMVVLGGPGSGKSALLAEILGTVPTPAVMVRSGALRRGGPLSGLSAILAAHTDPRAARLGEHVASQPARGSTPAATAGLVLDTLRDLGAAAHLFLIDDVELLDVESQTVLALLSGRLTGTGLRLVASADFTDPGILGTGMPALHLDPLDRLAAEELAVAAGRGSDESTLRVLAGFGAGNPAVVVELVLALTEDEARGRDPLATPRRSTPTSVRVAQGRLTALSRRERDALDTLSLAPLTFVDALEDADEDAVDTLRSCGLVAAYPHHVAVADQVVRSVVYWGMDAHTRRERHELLAASNAGCDESLADWHRSFARHAAPGLADALLGHALDFARLGRSQVAMEFAERAARLGRNGLDQRMVFETASTLLADGATTMAERDLRWAVDEDADPETALRFTALRTAVHYARTGQVLEQEIDAAVTAHALQAPTVACRVLDEGALWNLERGDFASANAQLQHGAVLLAASGRPPERFHTSIQEVSDLLTSSNPRGPALSSAGALAGLSDQELVSRASALSVDGRDELASRICAFVLSRRPPATAFWRDRTRYEASWVEIRSGHYQRARVAAEEWRRLSNAPRAAEPSRLLLEAWLATARDEFDVQDRLEECIVRSEVEDNRLAAARALTLRGTLALLDGEPADAAGDLDRAASLSEGFGNAALVRHAAELVEAQLLAFGRVAALEAWQRVRDASWTGAHWWLRSAQVRIEALLDPDDERAIAALQRERLDRSRGDAPYEQARITAVLARRLLMAGRDAEAARTQLDARARFTKAGAAAWGRRLTIGVSAPERTDPAPSALVELSPEEHRIAALVQQGYKNKEVAAALFVSLRTVELRLTGIYRKVGARSRSHLVSMMR